MKINFKTTVSVIIVTILAVLFLGMSSFVSGANSDSGHNPTGMSEVEWCGLHHNDVGASEYCGLK